jgi:hypothetical protein
MHINHVGGGKERDWLAEFSELDGTKPITLHMFWPGKYELLLTADTLIRVPVGTVEVDGAPLNRHGRDIEFQAGKRLSIKVDAPAVILCIYDRRYV